MDEINYLKIVADSIKLTLWDVLPILLVLGFFQTFVIRKTIPHLKQFLVGMLMVILGLAIFIVGLEECIFPLGTSMANQLSNPTFLIGSNEEVTELLKNGKRIDTQYYFWMIAFAFCIGFSTTLAEPALIAVAIKAKEITTGAIKPWGLRIAVAFGVGIGVALGSYRIVEGSPIHYYIIGGYCLLLLQTYFAPKYIIPLAYDSGGVTTSTVTVPLVVALGIGLANNIPEASPLLDGFGLIAFASLFPMITVQAYAMITAKLTQKNESQIT